MRIRTIGDFITADIKALFTILTVSRAFLTDEYLKCYRNALELIIYYSTFPADIRKQRLYKLGL